MEGPRFPPRPFQKMDVVPSAKFMDFINQMINVLYGVVGIVMGYIIVILGVFCAYFFVGRKKKKADRDTESHVNYSHIRRDDSIDCLKFDTIADLSGGVGAIVSRNHRRFVAGISLTGFDFRMASAEDRYRTMLNMVGVVNNFENLQIRQESRPVLLTDSINDELEVISNLEEGLDNLNIESSRLSAEAQAIFDRAEETGEETDADKRVLMHYYDELVKNKNERDCLAWMVDERRAIVEQYRLHSGDNIDPERSTIYLVEWTYTLAEHASRELTNSEIYQEARRKLLSKLEPLMNALSRCSVSTHVLSCEEMLDTVRHHFAPYTATKTTIEEALNSSYTHIFTTADFSDLEKEYDEERDAETAYNEYVAAVREEEQLEERQTQTEIIGTDGVTVLESGGENL